MARRVQTCLSLLLAPPEVACYNLGRFDRRQGQGAWFRRADWFIGSARAAGMTHAHLFEFIAAVAKVRLQLFCARCRNFDRRGTIRRVAKGFISDLDLVCCRAESESSWHSEFGWTRDDVVDLLIEFEDRRKHGEL